MESIYSVLTLENSEFQVPFKNVEQFKQAVEDLTGILSCCQQYYKNGHTVCEPSHAFEIKFFQVTQRKIPASSYFIQVPLHGFKVNILSPAKKTIRNLLCMIHQKCRSLNFSDSSSNCQLFLNSSPLELTTSLSEIPPDSTLELRWLSTYPNSIHLKSISKQFQEKLFT